jgi:amino acid adenylation domain-containing protein
LSEPVGILLPQTVWPVVAIMGILKAGKAYVPLDPALPPAQIEALIGHSAMELIITDRDTNDALSHLIPASVQRTLIDDPQAPSSVEQPPDVAGPDSLSYIIYTSGTTGQPKAVYANHRSLLHLTMRFSNLVEVRPADRFSLARSTRVGGSIKDVFCSLLNGAMLVVFDFPRIGLTGLAQGFRQHRVSIASMMLSAFREMAQSVVGQERLHNLRLVLAGGEMMKPQDAHTLLGLAAPDAKLCQAYAITEMGNIVTAQLCDASTLGDDPACAGRPLPDMEINILDEDNGEAPPGKIGRVACRSIYLPNGYWRDPSLTNKYFLDPEAGSEERIFVSSDLGYMDQEGRLFLVGRQDHRVRIDGQFVDTLEVERQLVQLSEIEQAEVVAAETGSGFTQLVAYLKSKKVPPPAVDQLRHQLANRLSPAQMPARFVFLEAFPLTLSGKLDRQRLPTPNRARPRLATPYLGPSTPFEEELVSIWQDALEINCIGILDPFLDLGGNSLQAMRIAARIRDSFAFEMPVSSLFAGATVSELALMIMISLVEADETGAPETESDVRNPHANPQ